MKPSGGLPIEGLGGEVRQTESAAHEVKVTALLLLCTEAFGGSSLEIFRTAKAVGHLEKLFAFNNFLYGRKFFPLIRHKRKSLFCIGWVDAIILQNLQGEEHRFFSTLFLNKCSNRGPLLTLNIEFGKMIQEKMGIWYKISNFWNLPERE